MTRNLYSEWLQLDSAKPQPTAAELLGVHPEESSARLIRQAAERQGAKLIRHLSGRNREEAVQLLQEIDAACEEMLQAERRTKRRQLPDEQHDMPTNAPPGSHRRTTAVLSMTLIAAAGLVGVIVSCRNSTTTDSMAVAIEHAAADSSQVQSETALLVPNESPATVATTDIAEVSRESAPPVLDDPPANAEATAKNSDADSSNIVKKELPPDPPAHAISELPDAEPMLEAKPVAEPKEPGTLSGIWFDAPAAATDWMRALSPAARLKFEAQIKRLLIDAREGRVDKVQEQLRDLERASKNDLRLPYLVALGLWEASEPDAAIVQLQRLLKLSEGRCFAAAQALVLVHAERGEFGEAASTLRGLARLLQQGDDIAGRAWQRNQLGGWLGRASAIVMCAAQSAGTFPEGENALADELREKLPESLHSTFDAHHAWCRAKWPSRYEALQLATNSERDDQAREFAEMQSALDAATKTLEEAKSAATGLQDSKEDFVKQRQQDIARNSRMRNDLKRSYGILDAQARQVRQEYQFLVARGPDRSGRREERYRDWEEEYEWVRNTETGRREQRSKGGRWVMKTRVIRFSTPEDERRHQTTLTNLDIRLQTLEKDAQTLVQKDAEAVRDSQSQKELIAGKVGEIKTESDVVKKDVGQARKHLEDLQREVDRIKQHSTRWREADRALRSLWSFSRESEIEAVLHSLTHR